MKKTGLYDSAYMSDLRAGDSKNADGSSMKIERDQDVKKGSDLQAEHVEKVKNRLAKTREIDDKLAKEKLKEKRIKLKKRMRAEMGMDDDGDDGGVVLGTPEEMSEDGD